MENLNVAAEMHLMKKDNPAVHGLIAVGDVTVNDLFIIHNVKVLNVENDGKSDLAAVLPKRKNAKTGEWENVFHLSSELSGRIKKAAVDDTVKKMGFAREFALSDPPDVSVTLCREEYWPTLAYASISFGDDFGLHKIRIVDQGERDPWISYPTVKSSSGKYIQLFSGATPVLSGLIDYTVLMEFRKKYETERGKEFSPRQHEGNVPDEQQEGKQRGKPYSEGGMKR